MAFLIFHAIMFTYIGIYSGVTGMKRLPVFLLIITLILMLLINSCKNSEAPMGSGSSEASGVTEKNHFSPDPSDPNSVVPDTPGTPDAAGPSPGVESSPPSEPPVDYSTDPLGYFRQNMPKIDGSTSLIPLEAGIRAAIFGTSLEEAEKNVVHTSTYGAFNNLLLGTCDLVLTVPLSEEQYRQAEEYGVELEVVPIAMEGFVFVLNYGNPVDTLTQEQLRAIYSGEITNWKDVGGRDAEIVAYQRNITSGSQNYMITFMGDIPLADAPVEKRPDSMAGLMDVIALNDNAENSIGYSVYAYAADMYGTGKDVKFIKVDGVEPSKETMASGEYPLTSYNYAVFNASEPEDSPVRRLVNWMASYEGQLAIAKAGYVTVTDIGFDYNEMTLKLWSGTGTGPRKPVDYSIPTCEHIAYDSYTNKEELPLAEVRPEGAKGLTKGVTYRLDCLTDKTLQAEVNNWISEAMARADDKAEGLENFVRNFNSGNIWGSLSYSDIRNRYSSIPPENYHPSASCVATAKNGYLSVTVAMVYIYNVQDGQQRLYNVESAVWDLFTGERLKVTDLFYEGVDAGKVLNEYVRKMSNEPIMTLLGSIHEMKRDFAGLTLTGWALTPDRIYIGQDNPYFGYGVFFDLDPESGFLACERPRDMTGCFDPEKVRIKTFFRTTERNRVYERLSNDYSYVTYLREDSYPTAAKINGKIESIINNYFTEDKIKAYVKEQGLTFGENDFYEIAWIMNEYVGRFVEFECYNTIMAGSKMFTYPYCRQPFYFDLATGDELDWRTLNDEEWFSKQKYSAAEYENLALIDISYSGSRILFHLQEKGNYEGEVYMLNVPPEHMVW